MKTKTIYATLLAFALLTGLGNANAQTVIINPSDDATIFQNGPNSNSGESANMTIRNQFGGTNPYYWGRDGLVNFDINTLPANAEILSAKLNLYYHYYWDNNPAGRPLNCYRIAEPWEEMTVTWNTQPAYFPQPTATAIVPNTQGKWMTWDVTADVQDIVSNPDAVNYGWKITDEQYWGWADIPITYFYTKENDSLIPYLEIELAIPPTPGWEVIGGAEHNMTLLAEITFDRDPFVAGGDNMAAAFGPGGEDDCRALGAGQDGLWTFTIVSNTDSQEVISFKIYDEATATVYECNETILFESDAIIGTPEEPFLLTVTTYDFQLINFTENWNWISFNIHPDDTSVESVFGVLDDDIHQVKNQTQSLTWYGAPNGWIGDLLHITDGEGYIVRMHSSVDEFEIAGEFVDPGLAIPLNAGWNWIGYLPQQPLAVEDALAGIQSNAIQIKGQSQSATWFEATGWIGDLEVMEPGKSYKLNMIAADELVYPTGEIAAVPKTEQTSLHPKNTQLVKQLTETKMNMVVIAETLCNSDDLLMVVENEAGSCLSIGHPVAFEGRNLWYFTIVENNLLEKLKFKALDESPEKTITYSETLQFADNATIGTVQQPFKLTLPNHGSDSPEDIAGFDLLQNYPNPFAKSTQISYLLPEPSMVKLTLYDITGRKVMVMINEQQPEGRHTHTLEKGLLLPGIYFYRLEAAIDMGVYVRTKRMVIR